MSNFAEWQPKDKVSQDDVRSIEYLQNHLDLPDGVDLQPRPSTYKDGSRYYALVATITNQEIATFRLDEFFRSKLIPLLKEAVHNALNTAIETREKQDVRFRDPNAE